ncbi:glycosyltransferase family 4 protein [Pseudovibrio exalbescens]|uniref:glycosyltransferase family 4 protein n=1 Tax=Pseudovibrio exalbescens TaxID=197461 RepID=UPI00236695F8|nr:glycosyltransferase family 4 protein [Pseudovibrio exalbescens]MDD7909212.1 glycosyltransferase family 4 protein [Pseudovibrio exalbescens]
MAEIWQLVDSSGIGGIEKHMVVLTQALRAQGYSARIVLLTPHEDNAWIAQIEAAGVPYTVLPGGMGGLMQALRTQRPALLHTHGYKAGILGRVSARLLGISVVSTFHAGETGPFPVSLYQRLDGWSSFLCKRISVSKKIAGSLPFSSTVIDNFINLPESELTRPYSRSVAFVGRLSHEKGPDLFCEFAATQNTPGVSWHLYGDGPMRPELEAKYGHLVGFHGMVSDLTPVWPQLGLLMISSRAEGLPLVALEAMAHGIPVLGARVGALPELIENGVNGWLFDAEDLQKAAAQFQQWAEAPEAELERLRQNSRRTIEERYSPEGKMPEILQVYEDAGFCLAAKAREVSPGISRRGSSHLPVQDQAPR